MTIAVCRDVGRESHSLSRISRGKWWLFADVGGINLDLGVGGGGVIGVLTSTCG